MKWSSSKRRRSHRSVGHHHRIRGFQRGPGGCRIEIAQTPGGPRSEVVKLLNDRFAETPVAIGLAINGGVVEVFATGDGSTWTIIITMPNGMSKVVGSGRSWIPIAELVGQPI